MVIENLEGRCMNKVEFTCGKCGKKIWVQVDIFNKVYKDQEYCLSCRRGSTVHREDRDQSITK